MELSFEQKLQIQKLDMQIAALPIDKQQQFARGQRELVPKYLAKKCSQWTQYNNDIDCGLFKIFFL